MTQGPSHQNIAGQVLPPFAGVAIPQIAFEHFHIFVEQIVLPNQANAHENEAADD